MNFKNGALNKEEKTTRILKFLIILIFTVGILLLGFKLSVQSISQQVENVVLSTISPNQKYKFVIESQTRDYSNYYYASFLNLQTNQIFKDEQIILSQGSFDAPFKIEYPEYKWLSENVLMLGSKFDEAKHKAIIKNRSKTNLKYIFFKANHIYFITDLESGKEVELPIKWVWHPKEIVWLGINLDSSSRKDYSKTFSERISESDNTYFEIVIDDKNISIVPILKPH